jgi:hypothetical protein
MHNMFCCLIVRKSGRQFNSNKKHYLGNRTSVGNLLHIITYLFTRYYLTAVSLMMTFSLNTGQLTGHW